MTEELTVTWLVADETTEPAVIADWCRSLDRTGGAAPFVQLGPGRGRLSSGRGAVILGQTAEELGGSLPPWGTGSHAASFALRQVHAPGVEADPSAASYILLTRTYVPAEMRDEFREWLETEHSQRQLTVPGNDWYRGYEEVGESHSFMNLWGLAAADTAEGVEWDRARLTPWRERMVTAMGGMDRGIYRPG